MRKRSFQVRMICSRTQSAMSLLENIMKEDLKRFDFNFIIIELGNDWCDNLFSNITIWL